MPIYEYRCLDCGATVEVLFARAATRENVTCTTCGSANLERLLSMPSVGKKRRAPGLTCCGRDTRCDTPPCSDDGQCRK